MLNVLSIVQLMLSLVKLAVRPRKKFYYN